MNQMDDVGSGRKQNGETRWKRLSATHVFPLRAVRFAVRTVPGSGESPKRALCRVDPSAGSSFALSRNRMRYGERLYGTMESIHRGAPDGDPNRNDNLRPQSDEYQSPAEFAPEFFEGKLRSKNLQPNLNERTRIAPTQ